MAEVSDSELALLRGSARLLDEVWNDPKHGMALKRAVKDKRPDVWVPDIDVPNEVLKPVNAQIEQLTRNFETTSAELAAMRQEREDGKLEAKFRVSMDDASKRFGLTPEGKEATLNLMRERQIADPEAAAALYMATLPKARPSSHRDSSAYGGSSYADLIGMHSGAGDNLLHTDPNAFFDREVTAVLNESAE